MRLRSGDPPAQTLSLAAGLALIEAIEAGVSGQPLMLKWPNDLMIMGKKLAGILLERTGDRIAVGFGVNLGTAPTLDDRQAGALGSAITPQAFAPLLAGSFARLLEIWRSTVTPSLVRAWQERAHPIGTPLSVHGHRGKMVAGKFDGLESDGALRLRREDGTIEIVRAGDVEL